MTARWGLMTINQKESSGLGAPIRLNQIAQAPRLPHGRVEPIITTRQRLGPRCFVLVGGDLFHVALIPQYPPDVANIKHPARLPGDLETRERMLERGSRHAATHRYKDRKRHKNGQRFRVASSKKSFFGAAKLTFDMSGGRRA